MCELGSGECGRYIHNGECGREGWRNGVESVGERLWRVWEGGCGECGREVVESAGETGDGLKEEVKSGRQWDSGSR